MIPRRCGTAHCRAFKSATTRSKQLVQSRRLRWGWRPRGPHSVGGAHVRLHAGLARLRGVGANGKIPDPTAPPRSATERPQSTVFGPDYVVDGRRGTTHYTAKQLLTWPLCFYVTSRILCRKISSLAFFPFYFRVVVGPFVIVLMRLLRSVHCWWFSGCYIYYCSVLASW